MERHIARIAAGVLAATSLVTGCSLVTNHASPIHQTSSGAPKRMANTGTQPGQQTGNAAQNSTAPAPASQSIDAGFSSFRLTSSQLDEVRQALTNINVQRVDDMNFYGARVYVPAEVPQGTTLTTVFSGGQAGYPMYVSLVFNAFTMTLLNQSPLFSNMTQSGVTEIGGHQATWYTRKSQAQTLYFLEYSVDGTYVSFTSSLQGITKAQLETVARSLVPVKP